MSEPDSTPRRRPPTIDLTAQEVEAETKASTADSAGADAATGGGREGRSRVQPYAVGIVVGAIAVAVVVVGLWLAGLVPVHQVAAPGAPAAAGDGVSARLDKIQEALRTPRTDESLVARMAAAEAQTKSLGDSLAALTRRVDDIAAEAKAAAAAAEEAQHAVQAGVQRADIATLVDRITSIESAIQSLRADVAQHAANADDSAARAIVAAEALRAAVERGAPYQAELAAVKSFGADPSAATALEPFAADGVPNAAALGRELNALIPALARASEPQPGDGSLLGRLESQARKLVRVTPLDVGVAAGEPTSNDAAAGVSRIETAAARSDVAAALSDLARLPDAARAPAAGWIKKAQARQKALSASERIAADALAAITKPASQ